MTTPLKIPQTKSTAAQRMLIHKLCRYDQELKCELVVQITNDQKKMSTTDLSIQQAQELINKLTTNWATFNKGNQQHMYILSLLKQIGWTTEHQRFGTVADLARFSDWLKSRRSPVIKPLMSMNKQETSKIITALEGIVKSSHS